MARSSTQVADSLAVGHHTTKIPVDASTAQQLSALAASTGETEIQLLQRALESYVAGKAQVTEDHRGYYAESGYPSIGKLANQELGIVGEGVVRYWISEAGYKVADPKDSSYDLHTRKFKRVEVKTSRIGRTGRVVATGIYQDRFDTLTLVELGLAQPRMWVIPVTELTRMLANKRRCRTAAGRRRYVGLGHSKTKGLTLNFKSGSAPAWLDEFEVTDKSMQTAYSKVVGK